MGRLRTKSTAFAFTAANAIALGMSEWRHSITFSPALVESYSVGFGEAAVLNGGLTIRPGMQPLTLTRDQLGDAIQLAVNIIGTGAATAPLLEVYDSCCVRGDN